MLFHVVGIPNRDYLLLYYIDLYVLYRLSRYLSPRICCVSYENREVQIRHVILCTGIFPFRNILFFLHLIPNRVFYLPNVTVAYENIYGFLLFFSKEN